MADPGVRGGEALKAHPAWLPAAHHKQRGGATHVEHVHLEDGVGGRQDDGLDVKAHPVPLASHHVLHLLLHRVVVVDEAHAAHLHAGE